MAMAKGFVNIQSGAGRGTYAAVLSKIQKDNVCPFCEKYFLKYHTRPILRRSKHWLVTENFNPYSGTKHHLLFVHRGHIDTPHKLTKDASAELFKHVAWAEKKYKLPGGAFFMRFGDLKYTGASVAHLHAQLITGSPQSAKTEKIKVTLGHKKK